MLSPNDYLTGVRGEIWQHLVEELIPFWHQRSVDRQFGGYLTEFDAEGQPILERTEKCLVMQARMVWSFARFSRFMAQYNLPNDGLLEAACQGVDFLLAHLWDEQYGGWFWQSTRDGMVNQDNKVTYGQSFAIYGLSEYTLATGDARGLNYASLTFDLLQRYGVDVVHGGYYERFARDWTPQSGDHFTHNRKSLNTHMHLMEAFTTLAQVSQQAVHARRLQEMIELIVTRMIESDSGAGHDWFALDFTPQLSDEVTLHWRIDGKTQEIAQPLNPPVFLNSYGHDVELAWLLVRAGEVLGQPRDTYLDAARGLANNTLEHGLDRKYGGLYRDGQHHGPALFKQKEWWQQAEALIGLLDLYEITDNVEYLEGFRLVWDFVNRYMINHVVGEWRCLLAEDGQPIQADLGHYWKGAYHTGRAMIEVLQRIDLILDQSSS